MALFCVCGGKKILISLESYGLINLSFFFHYEALAVDCVKQDHPEFLPKLVEAIADVVEDELAPWINENGGWVNIAHFEYMK